MSTKRLPTGFQGTVGGVTYTDRGEFVAAARALGYRRNQGRSSDWLAGTPMRVTLADGTKVDGQVWSLSEVPNYVWVALDSGEYVAVHQHSGHVYDAVTYAGTKVVTGDLVGKVAA